MIPFETERLIVRRWEDRDRPGFHRLNYDEAVMRFYPFRRDRATADAKMDAWNAGAEANGFMFFALENKADGTLVGMTGLDRVDDKMPFAPGVEIGWRLLPEAWGKGFATEASAGCLDRAFGSLGLDEVVSLCVVDNVASEAVMLRLGFRQDGEFDAPDIDPHTHPHLVRHKLYRLAKADWRGPQGPRQNRQGR